MRLNLGLERAHFIEMNTDQFADGEKFRIWHAKARQNAFLFTAASYVGGIAAAEIFMPQLGLRKMVAKNRMAACVVAFAYF